MFLHKRTENARFWQGRKLPRLTMPQTPFKTEAVVEGLWRSFGQGTASSALNAIYVSLADYCNQVEMSLGLQSSIRVDQALFSDHILPSRNSAFATTTSLRMIAVSATFGGFP
ncbi:MAG: hypothetical protein KKB02_10945, partial [Alphaproteobacteria bacterium]|nr:hypothetical protein [Alphaproteobacteria bacterium]